MLADAGADGYLQFTATAGDSVMGLSSEDGRSIIPLTMALWCREEIST